MNAEEEIAGWNQKQLTQKCKKDLFFQLFSGNILSLYKAGVHKVLIGKLSEKILLDKWQEISSSKNYRSHDVFLVMGSSKKDIMMYVMQMNINLELGS